ncbi:hypothetical protein E2C01_062235 [Portunus trituberculatus]|uniref:Uncharacterized protein n=1 Tax=Portunus trituberculatus TaxID=210409 RepID=A0A5B7HEK7_PORTR|nr:hypothetical protein [Portunus trituberculatus]
MQYRTVIHIGCAGDVSGKTLCIVIDGDGEACLMDIADSRVSRRPQPSRGDPRTIASSTADSAASRVPSGTTRNFNPSQETIDGQKTMHDMPCVLWR